MSVSCLKPTDVYFSGVCVLASFIAACVGVHVSNWGYFDPLILTRALQCLWQPCAGCCASGWPWHSLA